MQQSFFPPDIEIVCADFLGVEPSYGPRANPNSVVARILKVQEYALTVQCALDGQIPVEALGARLRDRKRMLDNYEREYGSGFGWWSKWRAAGNGR